MCKYARSRPILLVALALLAQPIEVTAQQRRQWPKESEVRIEKATTSIGIELEQSTFAERLVGGVLGGLAGGAVAGLAGLDEVGFSFSYVAGAGSGVMVATAGREGSKPSKALGGAVLGGLPLFIAAFAAGDGDGGAAIGLALMGVVASPIASALMHGR